MRGTLVVLVVVATLAVGCAGDDDSPAALDAGPDTAAVDACDWPMWGQSPERRFVAPADCPTNLSAATVGELEQAWFFNTDDVVRPPRPSTRASPSPTASVSSSHDGERQVADGAEVRRRCTGCGSRSDVVTLRAARSSGRVEPDPEGEQALEEQR